MESEIFFGSVFEEAIPMLSSTIWLWMVRRVEGPPNTPSLSPLLGSFCDKGTPLSDFKWSIKPQTLSRFVTGGEAPL